MSQLNSNPNHLSEQEYVPNCFRSNSNLGQNLESALSHMRLPKCCTTEIPCSEQTPLYRRSNSDGEPYSTMF
ncbi:hypothetical protein Y032_0005g2459 [Ancylostoma ceylanicum]|nr:hypothetical protein Y032_0005g2459 [Ancylostoma ceylanicum]